MSNSKVSESLFLNVLGFQPVRYCLAELLRYYRLKRGKYIVNNEYKNNGVLLINNFLEEKELKVLNNLVAAYFDLAELNAIEEREMRMADYVTELDNILTSTGRKVLDNAGKISNAKAKEKALQEYKKYKAKTLSTVEKDYLKTIAALEKKAKKGSRKK